MANRHPPYDNVLIFVIRRRNAFVFSSPVTVVRVCLNLQHLGVAQGEEPGRGEVAAG